MFNAIQIQTGTQFQKIRKNLTSRQHGRMATPIQSCQVFTSTIFVLGSRAEQNAANMIYQSKKGELASSIAGRLPTTKPHSTQLLFKTDFERMQYLLGLYGQSSQGLR